MSEKKVPETGRLFKIGKHRYAFGGLQWFVPTSGQDLAKEARATASDPSVMCDLFVEQRTQYLQYAVAKTKNGLISGVMSAAAVLATQIPGTWVGVFNVNGQGYWLVSVQDYYIHQDLWFLDETDAREYLDSQIGQHASEGNWKEIFAPRTWNVPNAQEADIATLLKGHKGPRLVDINQFGKRLKAGLVGGLVLLALMGGAFWYKSAEEAKRERAAMAAVRKQMAQVTAAPKPPAPPSWYARPPTDVVLTHCYQAIERIPITAAGYTLTRVVCAGGNVTAEFTRGMGNSNWFLQSTAAHKANGYDTTVKENGQKAEISISLGSLGRRGEEGIYSKQEIVDTVSVAAQTLGDLVNIGQPRLPPVEAGVDPKTAPKLEFAPAKIEIPTRLPLAWIPYLSQIPGIVVNEFSFDPNTQMWKISGDVYVRL